MRIYKTSIGIILLTIFSIAFQSCISTRSIPNGKYLLKSNKIVFKDKVDWKKIKRNVENNSSLSSSLLMFAKQKPNKTTLGIFKLNLWVYSIFQNKNSNKFNSWMQSHIGEAPVIFDSSLMFYSANLMEAYLKTKGYLNATVTGRYKNKGRKVLAFYDLTADTLYTIDTISYVKGTQIITALMLKSLKRSILKIGSPFDYEKMEEERKRIKKDLQYGGLYRFNENDIYYVVDTPILNHKVNLSVQVNEDDSSGTQLLYYIRHVSVNQSYNTLLTDSSSVIDSVNYKNFNFVSKKNTFTPKRLLDVLFVVPGEKYSLEKNDFTINRISDLGTFKFISLQYQQVGPDSLDCTIRLTPYDASNFSAEIKAANIENNFGNSLSITYLNRNLSKDATRLTFNAIGGVEIPVAKIDSLLFNISSSLNFTIPRILFPILYKKVSRTSEQHTAISFTTSAIFQTGIYSLYNQNFSFGYDFREPGKAFKRHQPGLSITYTRPIIQSDSFRARLNSDFLLKQTFSDQLITGCNYTFTFSNQKFNRLKDFFVIRTGLELAGGMLSLLNDVTHLIKFKEDTVTSQSLILNVPYSNYLRLEFDYKYYWLFTKNRNLVVHFFTGIGLPFSNSFVLPYIRQFAVGGPNDIRAWRIRSLGPGASNSNELNGFYNQTADLKLEGNLEYRFHIIGVLRGAFFTDAGNIWMLKKNKENLKANIDINRFYKEIAIGAGAGLRLDFNYFIFRGDVAMPLRNPSLFENERWVFNKIDFASSAWRKDNLLLNIAIGYPF